MKYESVIQIIGSSESEKKDVWKIESGVPIRAESEERKESGESVFGPCVSDVKKEEKMCGAILLNVRLLNNCKGRRKRSCFCFHVRR